MSKNKKKIIIVAIIILLPLFIFIADFGVQSCVVMNYLCQKYDAHVYEFKLNKYSPEHFEYMTPDTSVLLDFRHCSPLWEYEYNGVLFNVQKLNPYEYKYFDDYQLEDIAKWSVEYLQETVDENIVGHELISDILLIFANRDDDYRTKPFTKENIVEYINCYEQFNVYYRDNGDYTHKDVQKLESNFKQNNDCSAKIHICGFLTEDKKIEKIHNYVVHRPSGFEFDYVTDVYFIDRCFD